MDPNSSIEIQRVGNGFIVRPGYDIVQRDRGIMYQTSDQMVFETLARLTDWLGLHFPESAHKWEKVEQDRNEEIDERVTELYAPKVDRRLIDK